MKVVLVNPPQRFLSNPRAAEPLGLMCIEGALRYLGVDVQTIDLSCTPEAELPPADVYGFTAVTPAYRTAVELARQVRPAYTVLGGPHASAVPNAARVEFDAVVVGPGEGALRSILSDAAGPRHGGIFQNTEVVGHLKPARVLWERIEYQVLPGRRSASIMSARGCPFDCSYCASSTIWSRRLHSRPVQHVIEEVEELRDRYGIRTIKFIDDTFTVPKSRFFELADALMKTGVHWLCGTRTDAVDDDVLAHLAAAGCTQVDFGVESVDDAVLKRINKRATVAQAREAIATAKRHGLAVRIFLIYGLPDEPEDIVERTIRFVQETQPAFVAVYTCTPYPGCALWRFPQHFGIEWIEPNYDAYCHSVGDVFGEGERPLPIRYRGRSPECMRLERNRLRTFAREWNAGGAR